MPFWMQTEDPEYYPEGPLVECEDEVQVNPAEEYSPYETINS